MFEQTGPASLSGLDGGAFIARAPRTVPGAVRLRLLLGGFVVQMGWLFLGAGVLFSWVFAGNSELMTYLTFAGQTEHTQGRVLDIERTSASDDDGIIYAIHYGYEVGGEAYQGTSYTSDPPFDGGESVHIEYLASKPSASHITGMRQRHFSAVVSLVLIFPLVGLGIILYGLRRGMRNIRLLACGQATMGTLVNKRETGGSINEQPIYELTFRYRDELGRDQQGAIRTVHTAPVEDEAHERLLYDPRRPQHIALLDALGRDVRVNDRGHLIAPRSGLPVLVVPFLAAFFIYITVSWL